MKNLNPLSLLMILLSLFSCERDQLPPPITTEFVKIVLDMEEEQFLFDGHWYPWEIPIVGCQPSYSLYLDWEEASLQLRQCEAGGALITESLILRHSTCADTRPEEIEVVVERAFRTYQLQLPPERLACWRTDRQWLELFFEVAL